MKRTIVAVSIVASIISPMTAMADKCIDWGRLMTSYEIDTTPKWKTTILLQTFDDFTKVAGDEWLSSGIPYLLAQYLVITDNISTLFGPSAKYSPAAVSPAYTISGMYQHVEGRLRVFIKLEKHGNLLKQYQLDMVYPQHRQLFDTLGDTTLSMLEFISPKYDKKKFEVVRNQTGSLPAYENYIRGLLAYWTFNIDQMDIAKTWFEEAKKADVYYQNAYLGMTGVYTFTALYNKQNKRAFSNYFEQAEKELQTMEKFAKRPPPPDRPKKYVILMKQKPWKITNRFLLAHSSFVAGLDASGSKRWLEAAKYFEETVTYTPEDAITWYYLSQMREKSGDRQKASAALAKAGELNKCLQ